jgi:hypothetical protein
MNVEISNQVASPADAAIIQAFAKLDRAALGLALGVLSGLTVFLATIFLIIKGGEPLGPNLALLGQFFVGYSVTTAGAFVGLAYGFASGFILGWLIAFLRNSILDLYLLVVKARSGLASSLDSLD